MTCVNFIIKLTWRCSFQSTSAPTGRPLTSTRHWQMTEDLPIFTLRETNPLYIIPAMLHGSSHCHDLVNCICSSIEMWLALPSLAVHFITFWKQCTLFRNYTTAARFVSFISSALVQAPRNYQHIPLDTTTMQLKMRIAWRLQEAHCYDLKRIILLSPHYLLVWVWEFWQQ